VAAAYAAAFAAAAHLLLEPVGVDAGVVAGETADLPESLTVAGADGHHLARARRLRAGEELTVANGAGRWRPYRVVRVADGELALDAIGATRAEPVASPRLTVAFALTKGVKPETVVRQLTELGVDEIQPVIAQRSISRPRPDRAGTVEDRLRRVAREAAMQSRRARLPVIAPLAPLTDLAGRPGLVVGDRDGESVGALGDPGPAGWTLVVGPEGGLAPEDLGVLRGARSLGVGPHVLRAETAAVAVAAVLAATRTVVPWSPVIRPAP
jgi:16S rRNA (uracil1498-N3)-methyltransferase